MSKKLMQPSKFVHSPKPTSTNSKAKLKNYSIPTLFNSLKNSLHKIKRELVVKSSNFIRRRRAKQASALAISFLIIAGLLVWLWPAKAIGRPTVIEQQYTLVNCPGTATVAQACNTTSTTDTPTNGALGLLYWSPEYYGGELKVYFEAVFKNSSGSNTSTATLYSQTSGSAVTGAALTTSSTGFTRVRSGDIGANLTAKSNYTVRIKTTAGTNTLQAARLIVVHTFNNGLFTHTSTAIDIGNNATTTSTSYVDVPDFKIWKYEASKFDGDVTFYLHATLWTNGAARNAFVRLFDITANTDVPLVSAANGGCTPDANSLCVRGSSPLHVDSQFTAGLADGHEYKLQFRTSAGTASMALARLYIDQTPTIEQKNTGSSYLSQFIGSASTNLHEAQSLSVGQSGYYAGFSLFLAKVGNPTDLLDVTIRETLDGAKLEEFFVAPSSVGSSSTTTDIKFYFPRPVWLTGGTPYYIQLTRTGAVDASNYWIWKYIGSDSYAKGSQYTKSSGSWASDTADDNAFVFFRDYPTKLQTLQQQIASINTQSGSTYVAKDYHNLFDPGNFVNVKNTYYFETTLKSSGAPNTSFANLRDITTPGDISGSEVLTLLSSYTRLRSGDITSNMPSSAKTMDTQIKNPLGTASISNSWLVIDINVGPTVTSIAPNKGPAAAGTPLTIYGSGFRPGATVTVGGSSATEVFVVSSSQINAKAPSGSAGLVDVVVTNADGTSETYKNSYTYQAATFALTKTVTADFTSGTLTNLNTSGVQIDMANFLWQNSTGSTTGGSMSANTYYYAVTATDSHGNETMRGPESRGVVTTGSTSSVALKWRPISGATGYKLYRTTTSGTYSTPALITTLTSVTGSDSITYTDTASSASSGAPPGSNGTGGEMSFSYGTVPSSGAGTFTAGPAVSSNSALGAHSIQRPDGKFLIIIGGNATSVYDPIANSVTAGPGVVGTVGINVQGGGHSFQRPDGKFLVVLGGSPTGTSDTSIYDPVANSFAAGPAIVGTAANLASYGAHSIQRPDGKFLLVQGGTSSNTSIYNPVANTFAAGPAVVGTSGNNANFGAHSIQLPDGKYLVFLGNASSNTSIYDPVANTFAAGPAVAGTGGNNNVSSGAHSIQRPDGKYLVFLGNASSNTSIYDPVANTFAAGPAVVGTSGNNANFGAHSIQRPDGKYLVFLGNASSNTSIYDPVANTFAAGPAVVGTAGNNAGSGAHSIQRPDGKYLLTLGEVTTNTSIYDAGWNSGTTAQNGTVGTYTSEALSPTAIASWSKLSWQQTADNDINKVEVRTATSSGGLTSAGYRTVSNGGDIGAGSGEVWAQVKITYIRTVRTHDNTHSGNMTNVWRGDSATHSNRKFDIPDISSLTLTYAKLQVTSVAPNAGPTGGGTPFTLTGTGFEKGATVTIGGASAIDVFVVSSTTLTGLTPTGTAGARDIVVSNPTAGLTATLAASFTYTATASYDDHIKSVTSDFTPGTLTNISASGIKIDEGVFQWLDSTPSTTGGSMTANTYYYAVTATDFGGGETTRAAESRGVTTTGSTSSVSLKWRPVPGATGYKIYRTTTSGTYSTPALITTLSAANSSTTLTEISHTDTAASASSGAPPGSNTTNGEIQMNKGTVPSSGAGTFTAGPAVDGTFGDAVSHGAFSLQRPDGKFLLFQGGPSLNTSIYDPVANSFVAGPNPIGSSGNAAAPGAGAHAIERPDGKFLVIVGAGSSDTSIYDPVANTFAAGPATPGVNSFGAHSIKRSDGRFLVVRGNQTSNTSIYDPIANTFNAGPSIIGTAYNTAYSGAHSIQRPDGKFLLVLGDIGSSTSIYDPVTNTFAAGPAIVGTAGNNAYVGAHSLQRPDGKFLVVLGNRSSNTSIYDPVTNTFAAGPALVGGAYSQADSGAHSIQRPDGKFLVIVADGSASSSIYDPVANTFTAGPTVVGTAANNVYNGAHSLQRPDGKYLLVLGSSTANTSIYDAGWLTGTTAQNGTVGTYTSEPINPNCSSSLDKISWTKTADNNIQAADNTIDNIEIRTATSSGGISSASYRKVTNGGSISGGAGEVWIQYKVTFRRDIPDWSRADHPAKVWLGESSTVENRTFATPSISSITTTFNVGGGGTNPNNPTALGQFHSDGTTAIATGAGTSEDKTIFKATMSTTLGTDTLTLQLEIQPVGTAFTGTPNYTSSSIPCSGGTCSSGVIGTITITDLIPGSYHWQVRTLSASGCSGTPGGWESYPYPTPNAESATDLQVLGTGEMLRHGKHFIDGALRPTCESGYCR